jgi:N-sulfoglucosamine sulfohydrolase
VLVLLCCWGFGWAAQKNVLLIVSDDQGLDAGCYGNSVIQTPAMDKLAASGTRFDYGFCTTASCSASRSVILSGLYNHANGQYGHEHSYHHFTTKRQVKTLPFLLDRGGYRTISIGKYHVAPRELYPFDRFGRANVRNPVQMAEVAEAFIKEPSDEPFFVYYCTADPHRARKGFANGDYAGVTPVKYDPAEVIVPPFLPDKPEVREELAEYYQAVSRVDQGVGRLMQALESTGHVDDTLVIYISDNGIPFPGAKTTIYDAGIHLPLIVRSPTQTKHGVATDAMVTWADITPTILAYTGVAGPDYKLHGRSFLDVLDQERTEGWDEIYASHTFHEITNYYPMRVIHTRKYKYILNLAHQLPFSFSSDLYASPTWQGVLERGDTMFGIRTVDAYIHRPRHELYDIQADPYESKSLADDPAHRETLAQLQRKLRTWQKQTDDPWIIKYEYE